jgi:hypothetical protein
MLSKINKIRVKSNLEDFPGLLRHFLLGSELEQPPR